MPAWLHPGRSARLVIDGATIGYFGQLHPAEAQRRKLKQPIYLGELRLDRLYAQGLRHPMARELSRFQPCAPRLLLSPPSPRPSTPRSPTRSMTSNSTSSPASPPLSSCTPKTTRKSPQVTFRSCSATTFQSTDRTLREEELQTYASRIIAALETLGGKLRG